jgi:putative tricarboxylic transport membrane protein
MEYHESHQKARGEDLFGMVVLVVSVLLFWQSYEIAGFSSLSSPGAFPLAASATMVFVSVIVVIGNARRRGQLSAEPILPGTIALFTVLVIAYAVALVPVGFTLASLLFLTLGMKMLSRRGWGYCLLVSVCSLVVIYVIFRILFQVVLPEGVLPEREIMSAIGGIFGAGEEGAQ